MTRFHNAALLLSAVSIAACDGATMGPNQQKHTEPLLAVAAELASSELLKEVHRETARFHSTEQAIGAGYVPTEHCVSSPLGGMGQHWANPTLIDSVFDPAKPEVMLYEPRPNGQPKLVAVEYVVLDVGQPMPEFEGRPFDVRGTPLPAPHWSLHVWLYQRNPTGIFMPFNPTVSCN